MISDRKYTVRRILHYLMQRGEPAVIHEIAETLAITQSAARNAVMGEEDIIFAGAGKIASNRSRKHHVLWVAWEE